MKTDTYSSQMKAAAKMSVGDHDEDGVYDSADYPEVLDFVPETVFTLSEGRIVSWKDANLGGTYTVSFNQANGNADSIPDYQFLCSDLSGMVAADSRFYEDVTLTLDGEGGYTLFVDSYVIESGKRAVVGDDTGLGLVLTMNAEGSYTENDDGTYTTAAATHAVFEMKTDTYSSQMKAAASMAVGDHDEDGVYDSAEYPEVLEFVPETVWTVNEDDKTIVSWLNPAAEEEAEAEPEPEPEAAGTAEAPAEASDSLVITSADGGTTFAFNADGTYRFAFEAYSIEENGTYTFDGQTLTVTRADGVAATAEGDPLNLHYVSMASDQLTGDYTVSPAELGGLMLSAAQGGGASEAPAEAAGLVVPSDDGATKITFNGDGTYVFAFEQYNVEDAGTYTYEGGVLTVTNANGVAATAEGDPLKLHYVSAVSDQLSGDFTINAADLAK